MAGATILAFDQNAEVLEGEWHGTQTVLLEFESAEAAREWYNSDAYQEAVKLRQSGGRLPRRHPARPGLTGPTACHCRGLPGRVVIVAGGATGIGAAAAIRLGGEGCHVVVGDVAAEPPSGPPRRA